MQTGRRRILFLGDPSLPEVRLRYEGFAAALREAGIAHEDDLLVATSFVGEEAQAAVRKAIKDGHKFDAVAAAFDVLAMAAMTVLQAEGLEVPGDVAVTGYDNVGQSRLATPPLTTIDQSIALGGRVAGRSAFAQDRRRGCGLADDADQSDHPQQQRLIRVSSTTR